MNFSWWFPYKILLDKGSKKNLSRLTVIIGQVTVAIGIMVGLFAISSGIGARKAIKSKLSDFEGHILVSKYDDNKTFDNEAIDLNVKPKIVSIHKDIAHVQAFANKTGIIRTEKSVEGIVYKGVSTDFDVARFQKFIDLGTFPKIEKEAYSNEVMLSTKLANRLELEVGEEFVLIFPRKNNKKPLYRKFKISGTFSTDIHFLDDVYLIGDIKHVQKINKWQPNQVGGLEVYVKDIESLDEIAPVVFENTPYNLTAKSAIDKYQNIRNWIELFDVNILIIISLMMVVIIFNMSMVFIIILIERANAIGMLKVMGATNWQVVRIFINYGLLIMLPGILMGNVVGLGLLSLQHYFGFIQLEPDLYYVKQAPVYFNALYFFLLSFGCLLLCSLVLLIPSVMIARMKPTKTIKFK